MNIRNDFQIINARDEWLKARADVAQLENKISSDGIGFGDIDARKSFENKIKAAKSRELHLFYLYNDLQNSEIQKKMIKLQRSQTIANWLQVLLAIAVAILGLSQL